MCVFRKKGILMYEVNYGKYLFFVELHAESH